MKSGRIWGSCLWVVGCAASHQPAAVEQPRAGASDRAASVASVAPVASASPPAAPSAAPPSAPSTVLPVKLSLAQVLSVPISAIALGEGTRIAVLADTPYVGDKRGLRPVPLPAMLQPKAGEVDELGIYFGRDNEPRIMGTRRGTQGERAVYLRHLASGWRDGREEIGQLGGAVPGGLWGVLGAADPELVCRAGASCIIKRSSGWTTAPAGSLKRTVTLQDGQLWGLDASGISGIDAHGWTLVIAAPAWSEPRAFWATRGQAWVSTA